MSNQFLSELESIVNSEWDNIKKGIFFRSQSEKFDEKVYIKVMMQIFHYTKNNAINQAAAAYCADHKQVGLLRFAFKHALEELGHENMIVRDLSHFGVTESDIYKDSPLPATEALNGYLYTVALKQGVIPRLGYSFWAEDAYEHIQPILKSVKDTFNLSDEQMTFFVAHSSIDEKHSEEVRAAITKWVVTDEEKEAVKQVARTTLYLTGLILNSAYEAAIKS